MKIRKGFVSNSSSSSFIVSKKGLSERQIDKIVNHIEYSKDNFPQISIYDDYSGWRIEETDEQMMMRTEMDNFDMYEFLLLIGVEDDDIKCEDY